ncbi:hypothetical protein ACP4OV_002325 [Aristida adscensionis]
MKATGVCIPVVHCSITEESREKGIDNTGTPFRRRHSHQLSVSQDREDESADRSWCRREVDAGARRSGDRNEKHGSLASFSVEHSEFADEKHVEATIEKVPAHGPGPIRDGIDLIAVPPETYGGLTAKSYVEGTKQVFMLSSRPDFVSVIPPQEMYGRMIAESGETGIMFSGGGFYPSLVCQEPFCSQYAVLIVKTPGATDIVTKFSGGSGQFYNKPIPCSGITGFIGYLSTDPSSSGGAHQPPPLPAPADEEVLISNLEVPFQPKVDSGASMNVTGEIRHLSEVRLVRPGQYVKIPDGRLLQIRAIGRIRRPGFDIPNVHLVDGLTETLISVGQLTRDHNICTVFRKSSCKLMLENGSDDQTDWSPVGEAERGPNMQYFLRHLQIP